MSVLIKGMEMPKSCMCCELRITEHGEDICRAVDKYIDYNYGRQEFCPLLEIHAPHGRLIDADELKKESQYGFFPYEDIKILYESDIDDAPTIIPPEEK